MSDQAAINELTERLAEAKATIAALRSTERRYQPIFQAMDEGYLLADVLFDEAGRAIDIEYVEANPAATRMVGVDLTGKRLREVSPNYEEYWYEIWGYVAMTGEGQRLERFASPEGIWYDFYVFKPHPNDADSRRIAVLFQDVTRRKLAEIALRKSEARMRAVLQQAPLAIVFTGPSGDIQFRNAMFDELWGRPAHVTTAETYSEHYEGYHLDGRPVASEEWPGARAVLQGETVNDEVLEIVKSDGSRIPCWYAAGPIRDERGEISGGVVLFRDVSEERRTQMALRESEERQAFLLQLSDILRPLSDPDEIQHAAMKLLAEHYDVMRAGYLDVHADGDTMTMAAHFERGATPAPPQIRLSDYGPDLVAAFHAGCTRHVRDTIAEAETEEQRAAYRVLDVRAWIIAPLVKGGRLTAIVGVVSRTPRDWTPTEIQLVTDLAERTWDAAQRAHSEQSLRESEERFAQFAASSSDALWIRDGITMTMEYTSPAIQGIYGIASDGILGELQRWTDLIVPEDRDTAIAHIMQAKDGTSVTHEFRIRRPSDGEVRWIKNTDFPLRDAQGRVQRIGGIAEDVTEAKHTSWRLEVLVNELQHRARNLLGVVAAIANRTVKQGGAIEAFEVRLQALSRAQGLLSQGGSDKVEIGALVRAELAAHTDASSGRITVLGPEVYLTARQVQNFALALHELTTNAVKYGALQDGTGHLAITWEVVLDRHERRRLALSWVESGVAVEPQKVTRRGYGTELIQEALAYALQANIDYTLGMDGVRCRIEMPISFTNI